jgi:ABC-2 type transport system permease protein
MTAAASVTGGAPDAPLAPPAPSGGLIDVFKRRYVLRLLVKRELSARYQG